MNNLKICCQPYTSNDFVCAIYIDKNDILVTYCIRIYTVPYAHISKVLSFVDVDGTLPEVMYAILVCLFCDLTLTHHSLTKTILHSISQLCCYAVHF